MIFRDMVIKDLDEDILSKSDSDSACHRFATEAIRGLRKKRVDNLNDLLTVLGPRSTSWPRDMAMISALLVGTPKASGGERQHAIYQRVLRKIGWVAHGHLFHRSATMTGKFSWCATNLLAMPMAPQTQERLEIGRDGATSGRWKVFKSNSVPRERYVLRNGFPLVDMKVNVTLEAAAESVLLGEPDAKLLNRAIAAKVLSDATPHYEFMGPVYFNPPLGLDEIHWETVDNITIGGIQDAKKTDSNQTNALTSSFPTVPYYLYFILPHKPTVAGTSSIREYPSREESLVLALMEGDHAKGEEIIHDGYFNVDFKDSAGWTALHYAVRKGNRSIILKLLGRGADVTVQDELGQQCIHLAAERGDCDLLNHHKEFLIGHRVCKDGQTALHRAVLGGSPEMVTMLLDKLGDDIKDVQDLQGRTALHLCAGLGLGEILTELLSRQANPLLKDDTGRTALHYAVMDWNDTTDTDIVSTLLNYGKLNIPDDDGRTPLHYAAQIGYPRYVKLLSRRTDLAVADSHGETALHVAINGGHLEAVKELLKRDVERHELPQITMDTALHLGASLDHLEMVQALVNHGANIWYRDSGDNKMAVEVAVEQKNAPLTMYLTERMLSSPRFEDNPDLPSDWIQVARTCPLDDNAPSALHHAIRKNYQKVAAALIANGEDIFAVDAMGTRVISLAVGEMAKIVVHELVCRYGQAIWSAKQLDRGIEEQAASMHMAVGVFCATKLPWEIKVKLTNSWAAVEHLEDAFISTNDPEMQKLLTPDWKQISLGFPNGRSTWPMVPGGSLTPSRLYGVEIGISNPEVEQLSSKYRQLAVKYHFIYEDDDHEIEDSSSESDLANSSRRPRRRRRRRRRDSDDDDDEDDDEDDDQKEDEDEEDGDSSFDSDLGNSRRRRRRWKDNDDDDEDESEDEN